MNYKGVIAGQPLFAPISRGNAWGSRDARRFGSNAALKVILHPSAGQLE